MIIRKLINRTNFNPSSIGRVGGGFLLLFFLLTLSFSCRKPAPQLPSNKNIRTEETRAVDLVKINRELVQKEDSLLSVFVLENNPDFTKTETGFWYKKERVTKNQFLKKDDACVIHYQLYSLDSILLEEVDDLRVVVGKKEFIPVLDDALELMRVGESACFIFPWNLAFGMRGYKNLVPAYTSVVFKVYVTM